MRLLSIEGPVYPLMVRLWDLVKLNFIWLVFSLPIVTIGASTVAAYTVTLKMVSDEESHIFSTFWKGFKENWKQGVPLGLIHLVVLYSFYLNLEFFTKLEDASVVFLIAAIIIGFIGLLYLTYMFPLCARYHNSFWGILLNSANIAMKYFVTTLMLWVLLGLLIFLFLYNSTLLFIGFLIGPACLFLTVSGFAMKLFAEIEKANGQREA